ncbi:MAG TPA: hypothetical protein VGN97_08470 [Mesorhizobium sp.]|nr:hypothetical protein [Mesorhizobium sp.]
MSSPSAAAASLAPAGGNLGAIIDRIADVVEQETKAIGADFGFDLKASNARKSRCLYELSRAMKGAREGDAAEHAERLGRLRGLLKRNEAAVRAHLQAVGEVAALLQGAIERAQSDGTYGAGGWGATGSPTWGEF